MRLTYEPSSEALHISTRLLFLDLEVVVFNLEAWEDIHEICCR